MPYVLKMARTTLYVARKIFEFDNHFIDKSLFQFLLQFFLFNTYNLLQRIQLFLNELTHNKNIFSGILCNVFNV